MATLKLGSKAEAFELVGQTWKCLTELASDVIIEVGEMSFYLHKFPLVNRSGLLRKMISEFCSENGNHCVLQLHDIPGGAMAFELVAKFCYDIKIELNAANVVSVRCAAEHLGMTEDYIEGNLIMQTEKFLHEVLSSWKDSIKALQACKTLLPHAEQLHIVSRCINYLASKACADPSLINMAGNTTTSSTATKAQQGSNLWNGIVSAEAPKSVISNWWYEDASSFSLPFLKRFILAIEAKGMEPENVAGVLMFAAKKFLPGLNRSYTNFCASDSAPSEGDQRVFLEEIVQLLPTKKGVTSTKFLFGMLRTAITLRVSASCRENLERRIGVQLEEAALEDLLIPNLDDDSTQYDVDCVHQILAHFMATERTTATSVVVIDEGQSVTSLPAPLTPMASVAKLVDGYLAEVASDINLKLPEFLSLAAVIPNHARPLDDGIYRAIDIYLKTHPWLTESEKEQICQLVNCQKLSLEACTHAAQNERLPLRLVVQVLFFEQLHLRTSIAGRFVVSESMESSRTSNGDFVIQKRSIGAIQTEDDFHVDVDDMRLQVLELEKECLSMKQEIEKLGKPKIRSWKIFSRRIGFGIKS
ncbi:BTB/POZ domain-containing protein [Canna indica]|uniref:BTB/POZ domain-containing protein n=1 Tax=Canna indica TaxID=4628 RepID=A0AAQ3L0P0_9LILI|nr:BTB/POZ domain-containing protein [Canna indica]